MPRDTEHLHVYVIPGVLAIFLFGFTKRIANTDDQLWIVVGDLPSAYLVVVPPDSPPSALGRYCSVMEEWLAAVRSRSNLQDVFPVGVAPTDENVAMLAARVEFIRNEIIPEM